MSSRDNNLDELLREMPLREDGGEEPGEQQAERPDIEALSEMTEEEIDRLLAAGAESAGDEIGSESQGLLQSEEPSREDVLDILEGTGDRDLREIQDLLKKSDRKENIEGEDPGSENAGRDGDPVDRLLADIDGAGENEVATDAVDGRRRRTLKKEQKKAQKEEKKRAKQAEKAAKAAKGKAAKNKTAKDGADKKEAVPLKVPRKQERQEREASVPRENNVMSDKELLDSIVSGAGLLGKQGSSKAQEPSADGGQEFFGDSRGAMADLLSFAQADLEASEDLEAEWVEGQNSAPARDIIAVDMNEADSMLTDISQKPEGGKHKDGLLSKFVSFLTEEDDEPEGENEDVQLSEENEEILKDLDNEKPQKGKAKKAKKKPAKKAKKEKKAKPSKPPKPKKQKKPREPEPYPLGKRLTFKKALPVIVFGVSLGLVIFIMSNLSVDYQGKQTARKAYEAGDYEACYLNLFGKKLNDDEAMMFGRSESILYIRQWLKEYEMLAEKGAEVEALDSLIQSVKDYPGLYQYASKWKAGMDIYEVYLEMLDILSGKYGITETQALQIAGIRSDLEYTRVVTALAKGEKYGSGAGQGGIGQDTDAPGGGDAEDGGSEEGSGDELPDALPEESEIGAGDFVGNE